MECGRDESWDNTRNSNNYNNSSHSPASSSSLALNSSNIGFQLLKKHGWKEGTGLGVSQQGRLEPVETYVKKNKRGLGAEKLKKKTLLSAKTSTPAEKERIVSYFL
ncbi:hypothetical protein RND81_07G047800 [Saponaria officinalis]|uniref:G-patch domain-containing protein n=1 Tax=Saponaria officinalis TaxID=3572 RepID=A0AAW1JN18_SAPOF